MASEEGTITWFNAVQGGDNPPPLETPLLLWYKGAHAPVIGMAHAYVADRAYFFTSADARGVEWTHWAYYNAPPTPAQEAEQRAKAMQVKEFLGVPELLKTRRPRGYKK